MFCRVKDLVARVFDKALRPRERIVAFLTLLVPTLLVISLVVILAVFVRFALPYLLGTAFLIFLFFGDHVGGAIERRRAATQARVLHDIRQREVIWQRLSLLIIPALDQLLGEKLQPDELVFTGADYIHGEGFYFSPPRLLREAEVKELRHRLILRLYAKAGMTRAEMSREQLVIVAPDQIFIRSDPRILRQFDVEQ